MMYKVVTATDEAVLAVDVQTALTNGWQLQGGVSLAILPEDVNRGYDPQRFAHYPMFAQAPVKL